MKSLYFGDQLDHFKHDFGFRLRVFLLMFLPVALDFNFEWYINQIIDNFIFSLSLSLFTNKISRLILLLDFSANIDPNFVIFDYVDLS